MMICECIRSPRQYCLGWHNLNHEEWQTRKITAEAKYNTELLSQDYEQFANNEKPS